MYLNIDGGKKIAMPRYLKNKIYSQEQKSVISGYWKGEMEKRSTDENYLVNYETGELKPKYKTEREAKALHDAYQSEFNRMHKKATQDRDKI